MSENTQISLFDAESGPASDAALREKRLRIEELTAILNEARRAYEQEEEEIMSNFEYDRLYDELDSLEKETGIQLSSSPTVNVGYEVISELPKEEHPKPMLSLDKTKDIEALSAWLGDKEGLLSWKMDGLTIVLSYKNGRLEKAVTRGNGRIGEVITQNALVFANVPHSVPFKGELVLRGEAVISYSEFERINSAIPEGEIKYKNPRNLCSGTVRNLDPRVTASRKVSFYAFTLVSAEDMEFSFRREQMDWLETQGFTVVERMRVRNFSDDSTAAAGNKEKGFVHSLKSAVRAFSGRIAENDFPSDGLVLSFDDIVYGRSLGETSKFPRDSIAFKWADENAETVLNEIEWSASRTGLINPVAVFDPVELEGTTVSRASVHNISIMKQLELGIGDRIKVYKANMIIPQISENLTRSGNLNIPEFCPVCMGFTEVRNENGSETLYCTNPDCAAKKIKAFEHFVSRDAMNIEGLSEATLEKFIARGFVYEYADLFRLSRFADEISEMEGFGLKSFENIRDAAEKASHTTCARLLNALGIPNIGVANARAIARAAGGSFEKARRLSSSELIDIDGIGDIMAASYTAFFEDEPRAERLNELLKYLSFDESAGQPESEQNLAGLSFVITGSLNHFENRKALQELIESRGGKASGSVSSKTSFLINNDAGSNSTKNKTAKTLGVAIITEEEFIERFLK